MDGVTCDICNQLHNLYQILYTDIDLTSKNIISIIIQIVASH